MISKLSYNFVNTLSEFLIYILGKFERNFLSLY